MTNSEINGKLNHILEAQEEILSLNRKLSEQLDTISAQAEKIAEQNRMLAEKDETIAYLKKLIFGQKSERSKYVDIAGQMSFFNDAVTPEDQEIRKQVSSYSRSAGRKKKATHSEIYKDLPAVKKLIPAEAKYWQE